MRTPNRYQERYQAGDTPWDVGRPDFNLIQVVITKPIKSCKALDLGCGTGDNSIWLAQKNFEVTGIDTSEIAISKAKEKATRANVQCTFKVIDFLTGELAEAPFKFVFDRGCFHSLKSEEERKRFAQKVAANLENDGLWLSIIGNADEKRLGPGPPRLTARDIVNSVEPYFEIISLFSSHFESNSPHPPRAWVCLMCKRPSSLEG